WPRSARARPIATTGATSPSDPRAVSTTRSDFGGDDMAPSLAYRLLTAPPRRGRCGRLLGVNDLFVPAGPGAPEGLTVPASELGEQFSRASGPGGQGVNTTDSRVQLSLDLATTTALD